jgi:FtsP/CotA-like multicopper oxidase with cupredoxin domain
MKRRDVLVSGAALLGGAALLHNEKTAIAATGDGRFTPVVTPNGTTLPFKLVDGVKEFHLIAEPVKREFAPGMIVNCWGYNGQTPGPTIEAVEGDRVRMLVTNHLPERTSMHWHGLLLPNGLDGVAGLNQNHIQPGETYSYEFTIKQHGTKMYHPHSDEMVQMALGMMGMFVIHPRGSYAQRIDRDFVLMVMEWAIPPGTARPNPSVMTDFNIFTFNSRVWPGTASLVAKKGDRVRIRIGNLSMDNHPIHIHGHAFEVVGTDGGAIPAGARWPETTIDVHPGATRDIEFVADNPGDWAFHCHKSHHTMNAMSHDLPNMVGVAPGATEQMVKKVLPGYMAMGQGGMGSMMNMGTPKNTLPMMTGKGPFGEIEMGGMFSLFKVREGITTYDDPGFYQQPAGTTAKLVKL